MDICTLQELVRIQNMEATNDDSCKYKCIMVSITRMLLTSCYNICRLVFAIRYVLPNQLAILIVISYCYISCFR